MARLPTVEPARRQIKESKQESKKEGLFMSDDGFKERWGRSDV
jgi:hypothetical protein